MASKKRVEQVWNKAKVVKGKNPDAWRKDPYGNLIRKGSYGTHGEFGWEVDHKKPSSKVGSQGLANLQAVHTKENRRKSNKYPYK